MKILLTQHVKGIGKKGDIVEVSDGFAQNALIPQGRAKAATQATLNTIKQNQKNQIEKEERENKRLNTILEKIDGKEIILKEKMNDKGSLYHAISLKEIIRLVHDQLQMSTPNHIYHEKYAFKEAGTYALKLKHGKKESHLYLHIIAR